MDLWVVSFQLLLGTVTLCVTLLFCLKIKSSKKDPAIMGTEGTIYRIKDIEQPEDTKEVSDQETPLAKAEANGGRSLSKLDSSDPGTLSKAKNGGSSSFVTPPQHSRSGSKLTPPNRNLKHANVTPEAQALNVSSNRTPSRSGERKLPEIPKEDPNSNLYATVQDSQDGGEDEEEDLEELFVENSDSETEELGPKINSHHPYAKVKKNKVSF